MRIRQGNDFIFLWAIERNGEPEDFSNAVNIRLHFKNFDCIGEVKSFQIVDGNIVRVEVSPEWASRLGAYRLILSYEFEDQSYSDGDQKCVVDVLAFNIVPKTSEADDITEMAKTTDIMIGLKGDKGDPFTYDDFTPEQIEDLKRPAIEAAESVQIVENQISINEQSRVQAENERETAETTRVSNENNRVTAEGLREDAESLRATAESSRETAESLRVDAELLRQSSTQEAILNAEIATENANTAAQNADNAREAIQDDLGAKAFHGYASIEVAKTLKQVEDDTSVKMTNLLQNSSFENGVIAPLYKTDGGGGVTTFSINTINPISGNYDVRVEVVTPSTNNNRPILRLNGYQDGWVLNHVFYFGMSVKINSGIPILSSVINGGSGSPGINVLNLTLQNGFNSWTVECLGLDNFALIYFDSRTLWDFNFDNLIAYDLTAIFGEGNEPTKEEMDLLISTLGIDYFEGEITIPAQKIMQWQLKLIRKNKNAIIALGGTII
jgi:hypothetical protein